MSAELSIVTSLHGDLDPVTDPLRVTDVARLVDKLKDYPRSPTCPPVSDTAHIKPVMHVYSFSFTYPDPLAPMNVLDVATAVDALKGTPFSREYAGASDSHGPCADECPGEPACPWP